MQVNVNRKGGEGGGAFLSVKMEIVSRGHDDEVFFRCIRADRRGGSMTAYSA